MHKAIQNTLLVSAGALALVSCSTMESPQPSPKDMTFFITSAGTGKGADLGGLRGCGPALSVACKGCWSRKSDLARIFEHPRDGTERPEGRACARPHRSGSVA